MNNTTEICRLCMLNGGKSMESIFCKTNTSCIADTIVNVTHLRVFEGDGLPVVVCQKCLFQLEMADTFIRRCASSDKFLRSLHLAGVEVYPVSDSFPMPSIDANGSGKGGVEILPIRTVSSKELTIKEEVMDYVEFEEIESARRAFVLGNDYEDDNITIKMEGLSNPNRPQLTNDVQESGSDSSSDGEDEAEDEDDDDEDYKPEPRYQRIKSQPISPPFDITTRSIVAEIQKDYKCHLCPQKFYDKKDLKKHLLTSSEKHSYKCEPPDALNINAKKTTDCLAPSQLKMFKCSDLKCEQKFRRKRALEQHKRRHILEGKHRCDLCGRTFHQLILLRNHTLIHK